jgi:hypothetical protein
MEPDNTRSIATLLCACIPCLLVLAAAGAGIYYFVRGRAKRNELTTIATPTQSTQAPAAPNVDRMETVLPAVGGTPQHIESSPPVPPVETFTETTPGVTAYDDVTERPPAAPEQAGTSIDTSAIQPDTGGYAPGQIAPSEMVVLRGEDFAAESVLNSYRPPGSQVSLSGPSLAQTLFAAAFLALEKAGDVRLEAEEQQGVLGVGDSSQVTVTPTGQGSPWPPGSYEVEIAAAAQSLMPDNRNTVREIILRLIGDNGEPSWKRAVDRVIGGLSGRGLVEGQQEMIGDESISPYRVTTAAEDHLAQSDLPELQQLIESYQRSRPELWEMLSNEIRKIFEVGISGG